MDDGAGMNDGFWRQSFARSAMVIGEDGLFRLAKCHVVVVGTGGVGSFVVEGLARTAVGRLTIVDDDRICITNINRQIMATADTVGQLKVDVLAGRVRQINPQAGVMADRRRVTAENADRLVAEWKPDYLVDAIDTVSAKIALAAAAVRQGVPVISALGTGNKVDPSKLQVADIYDTTVCPLARAVRKELRRRGVNSLKVVYSTERPRSPLPSAVECNNSDGCLCPPGSARHCHYKRQVPGSVVFVPAVAGLIIAGEVVKDLVGGKETAGRNDRGGRIYAD
ncbi:MAG: tRNA threonylcarbamoyladenosine dehydratase [Negativicutes bacterium]|nr:tRNA threonylcarbamoyladenosine dehydratase [Negativicutes bacterium]